MEKIKILMLVLHNSSNKTSLTKNLKLRKIKIKQNININKWECCTEDFCNDPNANTNSGINDKFHAGVLTFILSLLLTLRL